MKQEITIPYWLFEDLVYARKELFELTGVYQKRDSD